MLHVCAREGNIELATKVRARIAELQEATGEETVEMANSLFAVVLGLSQFRVVSLGF